MIRSLFRHPIVDVVGFPVQTSAGERDYVRLVMPDWVNIVAIDKDDRLVLVRQHRYGIDAPTLEVPGGAVDPGEEPAAAALRELWEETGHRGGRLSSFGFVWSNPALQTNRTWMFLVQGCTQEGEPARGPGEEDLELVLRPVSSLARMLRDGEISHALAVVSLQRYLLQGDESSR